VTSIEGKVALVTGGSRGIGAAIVRELSGRGASIALTFKSQRDKADAIVRELMEKGGHGTAFEADVIDAESVQRAIDGTVEAFGRIDILVNNAGVFGPRTFGDIDFTFFSQQFNTNVWGMISVSQAALAHFPESGGRIVNVSSFRAFSPRDRGGLYGASKAAVSTMTEAMAIELGPRGITVNAVAPGITKTDMTAAIPDERRKTLSEATPLRRLAEPEDIAVSVAFLASDDSRWVTGRTILVDGGFTIA
jgi:3-oxoacyl-[acyl-carrier protein] reductase